MTKKITITISQDGTGNNKTSAIPSGSRSNVARLHETVQADMSFDFSEYEKDVTQDFDEVRRGSAEGSKGLFDTFLAQQKGAPQDDTPLHLKIYQDGVGSGPEGFNANVEGGTGTGTAARVKALKEAIIAVRETYGDDVEIDLNAIGFSRGSVAVKQLLNELSEKYPNGEIHLNNVLLFDPVASMGVALTDTHLGMELHAPAMADGDTNITEFYAANEYRRTFSVTAYQDASVMRQLFPGAHSQVGGGYSSDILAAGPLAAAINTLSKGENGLQFENLPLDDIVRMRLYNAVIQSPALLRTLITDSRIISEDTLLNPGTDAFALEYGQSYHFDEPVGHRGIVDERFSLSLDPLTGTVVDGFSTLLNKSSTGSPSYLEMMGKIYSSSINIDSIAALNYQKIIIPEATEELPLEVEIALFEFEFALKGLSEKLTEAGESSENPLTDSQLLLMAKDGFQEISLDFSQQVGESPVALIASNYVDGIGNRLTEAQSDLVHEEAEQLQAIQIAKEKAIRGAELDFMDSGIDLRDAIDSGNGVDIARESLSYFSSLDDYIDAHNNDGNSETEDGFLGESAEAVFDGLEHSIGLGQAIESGDGWDIAGNSADLLLDINRYVDLKDGKTNHGFLGNSGTEALSIASSGLALAEALEDGDGWGIAQSTTQLLESINTYANLPPAEILQANASATDNLGDVAGSDLGSTTGRVLQGAGSAIGLAANLASFEDVWESGDAVKIGYTAASTVNNAINTYNAIAGVSNGLSGLGSLGGIPVLSWVTAGVQLVQGDVKGAAVTIATAYLMTCGPWGWAAAAVLQIANMLGAFGEDDPLSASANFALDANGNVIMAVSGDDEMREAAESSGNPLVAIIQSYKNQGGRVEIDGSLPSLRVAAGSDSEIRYVSEYGGEVIMSVGDPSRLALEMRGALYARDRGDRIDDAIKIGRDSQGNIDFSKVDAHLAAMGFTKKGMTYTYGESTAPRIGQSYGTGVLHGGGNADGPEGKLIVAQDQNITSLALRPDQLPSQKIAELLRSVSLQHNFAGAGGLLLAMGLGLDVDQACAAALLGQVDSAETNTGYSKPLDWHDLNLAEQGTPSTENREDADESSGLVEPSDEEALHSFLHSHWPGLVSGFDPLEDSSASSVLNFDDLLDDTPLLTNPTRLPWWDESGHEYPYILTSPDNQEEPTLFPANNIRISEEQLPEDFVAAPLAAGTVQGSYFSMAQDSSLRFLDTELTEDLHSSSYSSSAESYELISYDNALNGTIYTEANGDIRFAADAGFVGTASFDYTLLSPNGDTISSRALIVVEDVNDPPQLVADHFTVNEGEQFFLDQLLNNDTDIEGDTLTIDHFRGLDNGELSFVDNRLVFTPDEGFTGDLDFTYWVWDRAGSYPQMGEASLTVLDQNLGVSTTDDPFIILEDQPLVTTVAELLSNDLEYDGESIHFIGVQDAVHGQVSAAADGTITFVPDPDYAGTEAGFSYTVEDDSGNLSTGRALIEVLDLREAPVVSATTLPAISEDETITFTLEEIARFVTDPDGDLLHLDYIVNVVGGSVEVVNGFYRFIPDAEFSGTASFDYQANDSHQGTVEGHLEFDILPVNDPVEIGEEFFQTAEETVLTITVSELLANDQDPEGTVVEFVSLGTAIHGTVTVDPAGTITFSPESDYQGEEAGFDYVVRDAAGLESTGFVQIRVDNVNDAPEIIASSLSTAEDQAIVFDTATVASFLQDADGDTLQLSSIENVNGGVVTEENGISTFTPDPDYHGPASLDYTASDGNGGTVSGSLDIEILSQNDQTNFGDDSLVTAEEVAVSTSVAELMVNDVDADGELTFVSLGAARYGSVSLAPDRTIHFIPEQDYQGEEAGFEYIVRDAEGGESTGFVVVRVDNVNDAPEVIASSLSTLEDQAIVFDAATVGEFLQDVDGNILELTSIENVSGGIASEENGVYTFTPDANYYGFASLDYTANDGNGGTVSGSLTIEILSQNDETEFGDDSLTTLEEVAVSTSVAELMANDVDADGELTFVSLGEVNHGSVILGALGGIEFLPEMDYFGSEAGFEYLVEDAEGNLATGIVRVDVENINDLPQVLFDRLRIKEDQEISFTSDEIAGFVHDPDNDLLNFTALSGVTGGSFLADNGIYTFVPDANFYGEASFDYTVSDDQGGEVSGTMQIDIAPVNDLPTLPDLAGTMIEDGEITFSMTTLMAGAIDVEDGTDLKFTGIVDSLYGDAWVDDNDLVHFLPDMNFFGTGSFSYSVSDSEAGIGTATVTVTVIGENDAPVAVDDDQILAWSNNSYDNVYGSSILLANDYDVDLDSLDIVSLGQAEYGSVSLDGDGNIHYQAQSDNWVGVDYFTYAIDDGNGGQAQATARVDVKLNTSPDAYSEILFSQEDVIALIDQEELLANESDVDGDSLFISAVGGAEHGSVALLADGRIQFTPELNFNNNYPGQASFVYTVSDGISNPVTAVAFVDLDPVNDAPNLVGERLSGAVEDNSFSFTASQLMTNDSDVEMESAYETDSIAFFGLAGADHGSLVYDPDTDTGYYTPDPNFCGVETFRYQVIDSYGAVSTGVSEIYVQPVNDNPVAQEDIGSPAETYIWNKYSIAGLLGNDFDVDGDTLSLVNPYVSEGSAEILVSDGYLWVKPAGGEDRVDVSYTVSDGHGGFAPSRLIIDQITEHNFAPVYTGRYGVELESDWEIWFTFQATDQNGGDTWSGDYGDIATMTPSQVSGGKVLFSTTNNPGFAFKFEGNFNQGSLVLTAVDYGGATGSIYIEISHLGQINGIYTYSPVVFDLDGDGVELLGIEAGMGFDWNRDGTAESSGWVAPDDGFLVYDYNRDSLVTKADELMLREYLPGAATDLEGLRAFDSNGDGIFSGEDAAWADFGVWQDANSNGITDEGEFQRLDELEIRAVELESDTNEELIAGNTVYGSTLYHREDGTTGEVGDVALRGEEIVFIQEESTEFFEAESLADGGEADVKPTPDTLLAEIAGEEVLSMDEEGTLSGLDSDLILLEAEISRIAQQLQSDAAAGSLETDFEPAAPVDTYLFDAVDGGDFQSDDVEEALLALA